MWLYRVIEQNADGTGTFYDAGASLNSVVRFAKLVKQKSPDKIITEEAENWPRVSWLGYWLLILTGRDGGFGVNFKNRHGYSIEEIKTILEL